MRHMVIIVYREKKKPTRTHSFISSLMLYMVLQWCPCYSLNTASSRTRACCSFWKVLLPRFTSSLHSHLCSTATCSERTFLILLSKRSTFFTLFICFIFLHNFHHYLLEISLSGWGFDEFVAASLALGLCLLQIQKRIKLIQKETLVTSKRVASKE